MGSHEGHVHPGAHRVMGLHAVPMEAKDMPIGAPMGPLSLLLGAALKGMLHCLF